jgi:hypothetical protein
MFLVVTVLGGLMLAFVLVLLSGSNPGERRSGSDWRDRLEGENTSMPPWDVFFSKKKKPRDR